MCSHQGMQGISLEHFNREEKEASWIAFPPGPPLPRFWLLFGGFCVCFFMPSLIKPDTEEMQEQKEDSASLCFVVSLCI